jgi:tRNA C32,U32 (ribose-2'-O)-methylase TrmJ
MAAREDMEYLYLHLDRFLKTIGHPEYKRKNTLLLLRRILGRAALTSREASTLHGLLRRAELRMPGREPNPLKGNDNTNIEESKDLV